MANERKCLVCGQIYQYCPSGCGNTDIFVEPWKYSFDTHDCSKIFSICCRFNDNKLSNNEAQKLLEELNLPKSYTKNIQKDIDNIYNKVSEQIINSQVKIIPQEISEPTEVQPFPITEEPKSEEVFTEVPEEPKPKESSEEQLSPLKGFRKRRLERQKQNEEN